MDPHPQTCFHNCPTYWRRYLRPESTTFVKLIFWSVLRLNCMGYAETSLLMRSCWPTIQLPTTPSPSRKQKLFLIPLFTNISFKISNLLDWSNSLIKLRDWPRSSFSNPLSSSPSWTNRCSFHRTESLKKKTAESCRRFLKNHLFMFESTVKGKKWTRQLEEQLLLFPLDHETILTLPFH